MALAVRRISAKRVIRVNNLEEAASDWLPAEVRHLTSQTAIEENREQAKILNFPTRVVIDKRATVDLTPADAQALARAGNRVTFEGLDNNIRFFYTSTGTIKAAAQYAWTLLLNLTRSLTGTARDSYYIWCSDAGKRGSGRKFTDISGALDWLDQNTGPLISFRILGPTIEYRRKIIYNPRGRQQQTRWVRAARGINEGRAIDRYRFTRPAQSKVKPGESTDRIVIRKSRGRKTTYQARVAKAIQEIVIQNTRRQFRDISIKYRFVRSKELPLPIKTAWKPSEQNVHIPELSLWVKQQHGRRKR